MEINRLNPAPIRAYPTTSQTSTDRSVPTGRTAKTDQAELSAEARERLKTEQTPQAAPEARSEQVAEVRQRIESGTYEISPRLIAERFLASIERSDD